ncbi:patatin-like phospholipase family protein [Pseudoxanthomonas japonensis]|uniref:patatin-like phospholipase family protein n=1 Tax=Pseudoxanthomonas japonensis TaxID=69284 RepID=UPI003747D0AB
MSLPTDTPIALALSGGGIRAMVFHLGVLRFLAEQGRLEDIRCISSVSGGSLVTGLIFQEGGMRWPNSREFLSNVYPALRERLGQRSMQWGALRELLRLTNLRFLLSRANLLAGALKREWRISHRLADLPSVPEWSINGTNAENGRRFRFKLDGMGDYRTGYAAPGNFPLANAMAVSAAFPGGFGPLSLRADRFEWRRRDWDAPLEAMQMVRPPRILHLYDGGVYDNLGIESFFDPGRARTKKPGHFILVSDAGMPLADGLAASALNPFRLKRVADIMSDQAHALRIRTFHHYLQQAPGQGAFLYIAGATSTGGAAERDFAATFPTTLRKVSGATFDRISSHGYHVAQDQLSGPVPTCQPS